MGGEQRRQCGVRRGEMFAAVDGMVPHSKGRQQWPAQQPAHLPSRALRIGLQLERARVRVLGRWRTQVRRRQAL